MPEILSIVWDFRFRELFKMNFCGVNEMLFQYVGGTEYLYIQAPNYTI